jgi:hypothetical protein
MVIQSSFQVGASGVLPAPVLVGAGSIVPASFFVGTGGLVPVAHLVGAGWIVPPYFSVGVLVPFSNPSLAGSIKTSHTWLSLISFSFL